MAEAIIARRGGLGEAIVEFDNFIPSNVDPPDSVARLYMPIGTKYKFGESEETATTNEITVPVPITGYIKFKNGVISNEV
jgi:hypothetical protein